MIKLGHCCVSIEGALQRASSIYKEAGLEQPRDEAEILLAHLMGWSRLKLFLERTSILKSGLEAAFKAAVERRSRGVPLAYITGKKEFYALDYLVNEKVLIPRPETELLVDAVLEWARDRGESICGIDLGCGCGNVAVSLACHLPSAFFCAVDLSAGALQLAAANALRHGVSGRIRFYKGDYFEALAGIRMQPAFNLVVSNPPYLSTAEMSALPLSIKDHEPHLALHGGADGLAAYRSILGALPSFTRGPGLLALEIGAAQGEEVLSLCRHCNIFRNLILRHDYRGFPRFVLGLF